MKLFPRSLLFLLFFLSNSCQNQEESYINWRSMQVKATSYTLTPRQQKQGYGIGAWGDTLRKGTKAIAVSRDLLQKGLSYNTRVKIVGLHGFYYVKDKMNKRWRNKIDVFFAEDGKRARNWGFKIITIYIDTTKTSPSE